MKGNKILMLFVILIFIALIFGFSSWTNAMVVQDESMPASLNLFSTISPLFAGVFILIAIALLVLLSLG